MMVDWSDLTGVPADFADGIDDVLTEAEVDTYTDNNGYAYDADLFSGDWADLTGIPSDVMDGDGDLLADMSCLDGDIIVWDGLALTWTCDLDADSVLTEAEVVAMITANGFALTADLATVATSGDYADLTGVPTELADGDDDTMASLSCLTGEVAKWDGLGWVCAGDTDTDSVLTESVVDGFVSDNGYALTTDLAPVATSGDWADLTGIPSDLADGDGDLLADMSCLDGDIIVWDGVALAWTCDLDADSVLTEAEVVAMVTANGFALTSDLATVATSGAWSDLTGVPADADTQLTEAEVDAYADNNGYALSSDLATVATSGAWSDLTGVPADVDTQLTEAEVDAYADNNGYALSSDLATVATSGAWSDLTGVPADADTQLTEAEVDAYANNNGYALSSDLAPVATTGDWYDLVNVPADLTDGNLLADISCLDGEILVWDGLALAWTCGLDQDSVLTEAEVDAFVDNNGYITDADTFSGDWNDLINVPVDIDDGDADTLADISCSTTQVAKWNGASWACADDTVLDEADVDAFVSDNGYASASDIFSGAWSALTGVPSDLSDGDSDLLAGITCLEGETIKWSGIMWECSSSTASGVLTGFAVDLDPYEELDHGYVGPEFPMLQIWGEEQNIWNLLGIESISYCLSCGSGGNGVFDPGMDTEYVLPSGEYNFAEFYVPFWLNLTFSGSEPVIIRSESDVLIEGTIDISGENGIGETGGSGGPGAYSGGSGNSGEGGGPGGSKADPCTSSNQTESPPKATNPFTPYSWWVANNVDENTIYGGSGGGSGCSSNDGHSGGGGGGGAIVIVAPTITITGTITSRGGGNDGSGGNNGGNGSGGSIWLRSPVIAIPGTLDVSSESDGIIRIDAHSKVITDEHVAGNTDGLPSPLSVFVDESYHLIFKNSLPDVRSLRYTIYQN
jgi:hypothetical protein